MQAEALQEGRPIYIEGRLKTRKWTTEIVGDTMQMLGGREGGGGGQVAAKKPAANFDDMDDDTPF